MPDINDRKMVKWQPFDSLTNTKKLTKDILKEKDRIPMPTLSNDQENELEANILEAYYNAEEIIITYYHNGYIYKKETTIKFIDKNKKQVILNDKSILYFKQILKITQKT